MPPSPLDPSDLNPLHKENQILKLELKKAQTLAALGLSSASILHDLANVVTGLLGINTQLVRAATAQVSPGQQNNLRHPNRMADLLHYSQLLTRQIKRAEKLVVHWKGLVQGESRAGPEPVNCSDLVIQEVGYARHLLNLSCSLPGRLPITIHYEEPTKPVCAQINGLALLRIIQNLLENAVDATRPTGGTIRVTLAQNDQNVSIKVEDPGPGIKPEQIERLFLPFQTTKTQTGTGLGLYLSQNLAREMNGKISVTSLPKQGATFTLMVPKCRAETKPEHNHPLEKI